MGDKLKQLETSWVGLVSKNYEIEQVILPLPDMLLTSLDLLQAVINMEQEFSYLKSHQPTRTAD